MQSITRSRVLGAVTALACLAPLTVAPSSARGTDPADVTLLNSAVEFERALVKAYGDALAAGVVTPGPTSVLTEFMNDHTAHLSALVTALQQRNAQPSQSTAPLDTPALHSETDALNFAYTVERTAAANYLAMVPQFKDRDLAGTAASILGVDATHVALLAEALAKTPAYPTSF